VPSFRTARTVAFTPRQMFDVVADIEHYPEFVPLCNGLTVRERTVSGNKTLLTATMSVGHGPIKEAFTTRVALDPQAGVIGVRNVDGPFSKLENDWRFVAAAGGCEVHFAIDYAFRSAMLALIVGAAFDKAVRHYTEAFEERARVLYGAAPAV
jgi:coenzyme Q-binding protein COQ10